MTGSVTVVLIKGDVATPIKKKVVSNAKISEDGLQFALLLLLS